MFLMTQVEMTNERKMLQGEVALWRYEVSHWRQEYLKALANLHRLEAALQEQEQALEAYAEALTTHEQRLTGRDGDVPAEDAQEQLAAELLAEAPVGSHEILKHWRLRERHELVKREHYAVLAFWSMLLQSVSGPADKTAGLPVPKAPSRFRS